MLATFEITSVKQHPSPNPRKTSKHTRGSNKPSNGPLSLFISIQHDNCTLMWTPLSAVSEQWSTMSLEIRQTTSSMIQDIKHNSIQSVMFLSRVLTPAEQRFWPTEMEVAGLVWVVSKLRHLIQSTQRRPAIIITDHAAATFISKQTSLTSTSPTRMNQRLVRASMYLSLFDLDIRYKPGKAHTVPDALSRLSR